MRRFKYVQLCNPLFLAPCVPSCGHGSDPEHSVHLLALDEKVLEFDSGVGNNKQLQVFRDIREVKLTHKRYNHLVIEAEGVAVAVVEHAVAQHNVDAAVVAVESQYVGTGNEGVFPADDVGSRISVVCVCDLFLEDNGVVRGSGINLVLCSSHARTRSHLVPCRKCPQYRGPQTDIGSPSAACG